MQTTTKRQTYRIPSNDRGYLLIEALIAIAVFSIGFLAVGALIISTTKNNTTGNIATQATLLAVQQIEDLKRTEDIAALAAGTYSDPNNPVDIHGDNGGIFNRSWTISDPLGFNTSREIVVSVTWDRLGQQRDVELLTITKGLGT